MKRAQKLSFLGSKNYNVTYLCPKFLLAGRPGIRTFLLLGDASLLLALIERNADDAPFREPNRVLERILGERRRPREVQGGVPRHLFPRHNLVLQQFSHFFHLAAVGIHPSRQIPPGPLLDVEVVVPEEPPVHGRSDVINRLLNRLGDRQRGFSFTESLIRHDDGVRHRIRTILTVNVLEAEAFSSESLPDDRTLRILPVVAQRAAVDLVVAIPIAPSRQG